MGYIALCVYAVELCIQTYIKYRIRWSMYRTGWWQTFRRCRDARSAKSNNRRPHWISGAKYGKRTIWIWTPIYRRQLLPNILVIFVLNDHLILKCIDHVLLNLSFNYFLWAVRQVLNQSATNASYKSETTCQCRRSNWDNCQFDTFAYTYLYHTYYNTECSSGRKVGSTLNLSVHVRITNNIAFCGGI